MSQDFLWADEVTWGTYVAPNKALPVTSGGFNATQGRLENQDTGGQRGRRAGALGTLAVAGPVTTHLYGKTLGYLLRRAYNVTSTPVGTNGFRNVLTPRDGNIGGISVEKHYSATEAEFITGAKLGGYTVDVVANQLATLALRYIGKDHAVRGAAGTVPFSSGAATPSIVDPAPYAASQTDPLSFAQAVMRVGGTAQTFFDDDAWFASGNMHTGAFSLLSPSLTAGVTAAPLTFTVTTVAGVDTLGTMAIIGTGADDAALTETVTLATGAVITAGYFKTVTSITNTGWVTAGGADTIKIGWGWPGSELVAWGTDRVDFNNLQAVVEHGLATDAYGVGLGQYALQDMPEGLRTVNVSFQPSFTIVKQEFMVAWRNGVSAIIELYARGGYLSGSTGPRYEFKWLFPYVNYSNAPNPELTGTYGLQRVTVEGEANYSDTLGLDHQLEITTTDNLAA